MVTDAFTIRRCSRVIQTDQNRLLSLETRKARNQHPPTALLRSQPGHKFPDLGTPERKPAIQRLTGANRRRKANNSRATASSTAGNPAPAGASFGSKVPFMDTRLPLDLHCASNKLVVCKHTGR